MGPNEAFIFCIALAAQLKPRNSRNRKKKNFSSPFLIGASERYARFRELTDRPRRKNSYEIKGLRRRSIPPVVINRVSFECLRAAGSDIRCRWQDSAAKKMPWVGRK